MASIFKKFSNRGSVGSVSSDVFVPLESTRSNTTQEPVANHRRESNLFAKVRNAVGRPMKLISRATHRSVVHQRKVSEDAGSARSSLNTICSEASVVQFAAPAPVAEPRAVGPPPGVLKSYINEVVSAPGVVKIKHEFLGKLIAGKEGDAEKRQESQRDIWRFHDAILAEAWDMNQKILGSKQKDTSEREERAREAELKYNRLKAQTLQEMTVLRDKIRKLPEGTQDVIQDVQLTVDVLEHIDEAQRALVKSCTEECIKGILKDAERGREGLLWQLVRDKLEAERGHISRLLEESKGLRRKLESLQKEKEERFLRGDNGEERPPADMPVLDSLKKELETLRTDATLNVTELALIRDENDQLRKENSEINEKLKCYNTDSPILQDLQPLKRDPLTRRVLGENIGEEVQTLRSQVKTLRTQADQAMTDLDAERQKRAAAEDALQTFAASKMSKAQKADATLLPSSVATFLICLAAVEDISALESLFKEHGGCRMMRWAGLSFGYLAINWGEDVPEQEDTDAYTEGASANRRSTPESDSYCPEQLNNLQGADVGTLVGHGERLRKSFSSEQATGTELLLGLERLSDFFDMRFMQELSSRCEDLKCESAPHPLDVMAGRLGQLRGERRELRSLTVTLLQAFRDTSDVLEQKRTAAQKLSALSKKVAQVKQQYAEQVDKCCSVTTGSWKAFDALLKHRQPIGDEGPFHASWKSKLLADLGTPGGSPESSPPATPRRAAPVSKHEPPEKPSERTPSITWEPEKPPVSEAVVEEGELTLLGESESFTSAAAPNSPTVRSEPSSPRSAEPAQTWSQTRPKAATQSIPMPKAPLPAHSRSSDSAVKQATKTDSEAPGVGRVKSHSVNSSKAASKATAGRLTKQTSKWHMMHSDQAAQHVAASDALATEMPVVGSAVTSKKGPSTSPRVSANPPGKNPKAPPRRAQTFGGGCLH